MLLTIFRSNYGGTTIRRVPTDIYKLVSQVRAFIMGLRQGPAMPKARANPSLFVLRSHVAVPKGRSICSS
jgi:hypothetical protein